MIETRDWGRNRQMWMRVLEKQTADGVDVWTRRFGYPDFVLASAHELVDRQYADRPALRPIYDAILAATSTFGDMTMQARKEFVSLVTPRRTFARVVPRTRTRVDLGLRLERQRAAGRLQPSTSHPPMQLQVGLTTPDGVDAEVIDWLRKAYKENA